METIVFKGHNNQIVWTNTWTRPAVLVVLDQRSLQGVSCVKWVAHWQWHTNHLEQLKVYNVELSGKEKKKEKKGKKVLYIFINFTPSRFNQVWVSIYGPTIKHISHNQGLQRIGKQQVYVLCLCPVFMCGNKQVMQTWTVL